MKLRVVTYNVHKCRGMDGRISASRIIEVLREVSADVIALQEVMGYQAEAVSTELAMPFVFGENRRHEKHAYGNVVLSRLSIQEWRNYDLSVEGREQRGCLRADLAINGTGELLRIFNVHLGTSFGERRHQGRKLLGAGLLKGLALQHPRIVLGDFNEWTSGLATQLLREHLKSAEFRSRSYPGFMPVLHLDHIYYDESLRLEKLTLHRTRKALVASDHLPLFGDFDVAATAPAHGEAQKAKGSK
ncbi:MAG TPA: endonuclease/exonuclease/phosphatase family protein [Candidatus Acidoferrum sp.]|jgi:endonuclease/exonuclease/phosphatase family metal-dependent hydrolase|nr:endonuclease/exonuclease/phosphatase family protein [Candidatus Acidoferrum sp.]